MPIARNYLQSNGMGKDSREKPFENDIYQAGLLMLYCTNMK